MSSPILMSGSNSMKRNGSKLVIEYHRRAGVQPEAPEPHAIAHVVVENQIALGEATPAPRTLDRLIDEGLNRHDAVHAIGSILMKIVFDTAHERDDGGDIQNTIEDSQH